MGGIDSASAPSEFVRLHITPFNADLYDRIIPPSLQPLARNRSFHSIQTFPDRGYGFVELPTMDAQKLKKKLHGSTLKGTKMSVEDAKPARKRKPDAEVEGGEGEKKRAKREKREMGKRENGVVAGHEIEEGRRVKRGWTGDDSREKKAKSVRKERKKAATDGAEERKLRFRTKIPPSKAPVESAHEKKKKDKKSKKDKGKDKDVVEEFTRRRKAKDDGRVIDGVAPGSTSYVEGTGWVDEDGNTIEAERRSKRTRTKSLTASKVQAQASTEDAATGAAELETNGIANETGNAEPAAERPDLNDMGSDSDDDDDNDADEGEAPSTRHASQPEEVHPLEALFKRPAAPVQTTSDSLKTTPTKPRPAPIDTSFSFFGTGDADDNDVEMEDKDGVTKNMPPVTPHTKQDLEWRSLRSAAPTPDTAAIGRKFNFPFASSQDDDEDEAADEEEQMYDDDMQGPATRNEGGEGGRGEESAFRRWFFENRGDLNRGWKKRRREERKVKRQRENRRLGRKVA